MNPPTLGLYVDAQHLYHAARARGERLGMRTGRPDYEAITTEALEAAANVLGCDWRDIQITEQRIYTASRNRTTAFSAALERLGFTVRDYILRSETDSFDWDVEIAVQAVVDSIAHEPPRHAIALVSGDGDFAPLLDVLAQRGHPVVALGYPGSMSSRFTSRHEMGERCVYDGAR